MADPRAEFSYPRANLIVSRNGFSVEVRAPSAIRYNEAGMKIEVFAEMLVAPEPKIAVRRRDIRSWQDPHHQVEVTESERDRIVENIRRAFEFKGWVLVVE
jgi:hypothetical protein